MSDIKRYDLEIDCESAYSRMAESEDGDYVQYQAYAAALSAKDARIAELDEVLSDIVKLLAVDKKGAYTSPPVRKILDWSARAELAIASQPSPAPLAATPSEDGPEEMQFAYLHPNGERHTVTVSREEVLREMPDFLFEKLCGNFCQCEPVGETNVVECNCDEYAEEFQLLVAEPNAVTKEVAELRAQHSRIVAAKDAEIARLKAISDSYFSMAAERTEHIVARDKEIAQLRAQPARQVGGDERKIACDCDPKHFNRDCTGERNCKWIGKDCDLPELPWPEMPHGSIDYFSAAQMRSYARQARAALAPAAVVMPERKTRDPIDWDECSREMATDDAQFCGFNAALDEVARLNRRAIPAEDKSDD